MIVREDGVEFVPKTNKGEGKGSSTEKSVDTSGTDSCMVMNVVDKVVLNDQLDRDSIGNRKLVARRMNVGFNGVMDNQVEQKSEKKDAPPSALKFPLRVMSVIGKVDSGEEYSISRKFKSKHMWECRTGMFTRESRNIVEGLIKDSSVGNRGVEAVKRPRRFGSRYSGPHRGINKNRNDNFDFGNWCMDRTSDRRVSVNGQMEQMTPVFGSNTPSGRPNVGLGSVRHMMG